MNWKEPDCYREDGILERIRDLLEELVASRKEQAEPPSEDQLESEVLYHEAKRGRNCRYPKCYTPVTTLGVALPHGGRELTEAMATAVQLRDHHGRLRRSLPEGLLYWVEEADKTRQRLEEQLQLIMDAMNAYVGAQANAEEVTDALS